MGGNRVKLTKCDKVVWGEEWHYASDFLNDPIFNLLFYCHIIFNIVRNWLLMSNLATVLPL